MSALELDELTEHILIVCDGIPTGQVASYGDIAAVVGTSPRRVGNIMATHGQLTCWWRVVRSDGTSSVADRAQVKWSAEGTPHEGTRVRIAECRATLKPAD
ncbi:MAG: MGMT family protein [Corynebacterium sp.]|nr:MGMT family protein [Corynebacterium sp.]